MKRAGKTFSWRFTNYLARELYHWVKTHASIIYYSIDEGCPNGGLGGTPRELCPS